MQLVKQLTHDFIHLLFPHNCSGCGSDVLGDDQMLCLRCISELPATRFFAQPGNPVEAVFFGRIALRNAAAAFFFSKETLVQNLVFQLKYRGNKEIGNYLGTLMGQYLQASERFVPIDVLVPLPLNRRREHKRGYNQATCLCKGIAERFDRPIMENLVVRKVYTETQTHMGRISRWQNMDGVFAITDAAPLQNKHVLLVDDVVTTGATIEACGAEILKIPGTTLSVATLAYTI